MSGILFRAVAEVCSVRRRLAAVRNCVAEVQHRRWKAGTGIKKMDPLTRENPQDLRGEKYFPFPQHMFSPSLIPTHPNPGDLNPV